MEKTGDSSDALLNGDVQRGLGHHRLGPGEEEAGHGQRGLSLKSSRVT